MYPVDSTAFQDVFADFSTGSYETSDGDDRLWAAAEMWATTGSPEALLDFETRAALSNDLVIPSFDWSNLQNLGFLTYIRGTPFDGDRSPDLVAAIEEDTANAATAVINNGEASAFGRGILDFYWGSNGSVARTCMILNAADRLSPNSEYPDACARQMDYLFGRNMYGRPQVTGEGRFPPCHPHDRRSAADNILRPYPGLLVGGASSARNWRDVQDSYQTNEVAINWNGALVYALAGLISGSAGPSSVGFVPEVDDCTETPPDPPRPDGADTSGPAIIIDDFEDGDLDIIEQDGRKGTWYQFDDETDGHTSGFVFKSDAANGSQQALSITSSGYTWWGAGIGFPLNTEGDTNAPYDATEYSGVSFWAKAQNPVDLNIRVADAYTSSDGGQCDLCGDHFRATLRVTQEWQRYEAAWVELQQWGWGSPQRQSVDLSQLYAIEFQWSRDTPISLLLDDVAFATAADYNIEGTATTDAGAADDVTAGALPPDGGPDAAPDAAVSLDDASAVDGTCGCGAVGRRATASRRINDLFDLLF
jgi:hypothetical protein